MNAERRRLNAEHRRLKAPTLGLSDSRLLTAGGGNRGGNVARVGFYSAFRVQRSGFSFVEIMFAVIILGIGFIMIAALFPVAIQQTQATSNDVAATAMANSISQTLPLLINSTDLLPTGYSANPSVFGVSPTPPMYVSFANPQAALYSNVNFSFPGANNNLWTEVSGSLINSTDPRYGWVGFYSRDETGAVGAQAPNPSANVIAIITQSQNTQGVGYNSAVDLNPTPGVPATLQGFPISVRVIDAGTASATLLKGLTTADIIMIAASQNASGTPDNFTYYDAAASGAFVVIAQDKMGNAQNGHFNGRVFRLGARRSDLDPNDRSYQVWELQPGWDYTAEQPPSQVPPSGGPYYTPEIPLVAGSMPNGVTSAHWADAFIVGRALLDPTAPYTVPYTNIPPPAVGEPPRQYVGQPNVFVGNSQAIAAYSFTIPVH